MELIIKLLAAGGVMGLLDYIWLGYIGRSIYFDNMGKILLDKPNMVPALVFYVIYVVGVVVFVVNPALAKNSLGYALGMGALFGFVAYATYDLTNLATMKGFSVKVAMIDLVWGACITAAMAGAAFLAVKWLS